jgi:hypothetical protein
LEAEVLFPIRLRSAFLDSSIVNKLYIERGKLLRETQKNGKTIVFSNVFNGMLLSNCSFKEDRTFSN